jgi:hypothetical protein
MPKSTACPREVAGDCVENGSGDELRDTATEADNSPFKALRELTNMTSSTTKTPPPPFLPFNPTKHPANTPNPFTPGLPPRTLTPFPNLKGTRRPFPIAREDSRRRDESVGLPVSVGREMMRPTTYTGSYIVHTAVLVSSRFRSVGSDNASPRRSTLGHSTRQYRTLLENLPQTHRSSYPAPHSVPRSSQTCIDLTRSFHGFVSTPAHQHTSMATERGKV